MYFERLILLVRDTVGHSGPNIRKSADVNDLVKDANDFLRNQMKEAG